MGRGLPIVAALAALCLPSPAAAAVRWCGTDAASTDRKPDVVSALQVHVIYAYPADGPNHFAELASAIASDIASVDAWWATQDATRRIRFDLHTFPGCDSLFGQLDISSVRLPHPASRYSGLGARFEQVVTDLAAPPFSFADRNKKYLVYYDGPLDLPVTVCGQGRVGFPRTGGENGYGVVYLAWPCGEGIGVGGETEISVAHELVHFLNALDYRGGPPNACPGDRLHACDSDRDILHPALYPWDGLRGLQLDVGRDDYYNHSGSWWDVRDSPYLEPLDSPDRAPPGAVQLTATSDGDTVSVTWTAASDDVGPVTYEVLRNGAFAVERPDREFIEMAPPGTTIAYSVRAIDTAGRLGPVVTVRFTVGVGIVDETGRLVRDTVAPPVVQGLRAKRTRGWVVLRWRAVADAGGVRGYRVTRNGKLFRVVAATSLRIPRSKARGVWAVSAVDRAGNVGSASDNLRIR